MIFIQMDKTEIINETVLMVIANEAQQNDNILSGQIFHSPKIRPFCHSYRQLIAKYYLCTNTTHIAIYGIL